MTIMQVFHLSVLSMSYCLMKILGSSLLKLTIALNCSFNCLFLTFLLLRSYFYGLNLQEFSFKFLGLIIFLPHHQAIGIKVKNNNNLGIEYLFIKLRFNLDFYAFFK